MNKIFTAGAVIAMVLCFAIAVFAEGELEFLKAEIKPCTLYSITENQVTYATSLQLVGYKGAELNGIYSSDKNMIALGLGYEITSLDKFVDIPLAKYCTASVGGYVGSRDFASEDRSTDWGIWATLLKIGW